ncbi:aquaporin, partial [Streptomyces torulosus]|uniref:aquaporin n=1 Tax=Streptomyces torulosus TaxID=68276 RepID=UPI000A9E6713
MTTVEQGTGGAVPAAGAAPVPESVPVAAGGPVPVGGSASGSVAPARAPLGARVAAEAVGTAALVAVVVGSGIQATELTHDVGVQLLANCLATVFGLGVLIVLFGPVSGAHFNPVVTLAEWWTGWRRGHAARAAGADVDANAGAGEGAQAAGVTGRDVAAYLPAQVAGAIGGAVLADAMFAEPLVRWSTHDRSASSRCPAERSCV